MQDEASELMVCPPVGELRVQAFRKHVTLEKSTMSETEGFTTCSLWRNLLSGTRAGDEALRSVLVVGSTSLLHRVRQRGTGSPWLIDLLKRKPPKLVAVALANKNARIAWKLMVSGDRYRINPTPAAKPNIGFNPPPSALQAQSC